MIGSTINPNTGDYSRGAAGLWIENGEIDYPVNEITIAGNLRDMFLSMTPANDARPWLSHVVPSLLIEGMTLAEVMPYSEGAITQDIIDAIDADIKALEA